MQTVETIGQRLRALPPMAFDSVPAGALSVFAVVEGQGAGLPLLWLATVPLAWRRRYPLEVFLLVVIAILTVGNQGPYTVVTSAIIATYAMGAYSTDRLPSLILILGCATSVLFRYGASMPPLPASSGPYAIVLSPWLLGMVLRNRQLRIDAYRDRALLLEREQEQATRAALAEERRRIARELHDVVAHSVSVMLIQAGAARQILRTAPEQASDSLLSVEASGRDAMTELRRLLGLLGEDGDIASLTPQPGIDQLESLIQRVAGTGLPVQLRIDGEPRALPIGLDLTAYRIVQEALTNALKYSGLAATEVILSYSQEELKLEILDDGAGQDAASDSEPGRGLVGMRERVALYGGTLEAGPRLERGYAVRAWLPLAGLPA